MKKQKTAALMMASTRFVLALIMMEEFAFSFVPSARMVQPKGFMQLGSTGSYLSGLVDNVDIPKTSDEGSASDEVVSTQSTLGNSDDEESGLVIEASGLVIEDEDPEAERDSMYMLKAVKLANVLGGERGKLSPFPKPVGAALIVGDDGKIIGQGYSSYKESCIEAAIRDAGIKATPLREWCVGFTSDKVLRDDIAGSTLYLTLEPSAERIGVSQPPLTQLIEYSGIPRVVIGSPDPIPEYTSEGAGALHSAGVSVTMGVEQNSCDGLISEYSKLANSKLQRMARAHLAKHNRPLGFLHCSVIESDNAEAFARNGNAFGKDFGGGQLLSMRDFGTYELAPPPESIWAVQDDEDDSDWHTESLSFFEEDEEEETSVSGNPMMPWYEQVDAVICTFPKEDYDGHDGTVDTRLKGLTWLACQGTSLPSGVQRILVMDASDLRSLPTTNDDPNLPPGVDVETFWKAQGRKPTRILLRYSGNALAAASASAAATAAQAAAEAAQIAREAVDSCDAEIAAEAAIACQKAAMKQVEFLQNEISEMQDLKVKFSELGVELETVRGGLPIDIMNHLGTRSGYKSVVWRAGCWGERGVDAILKGAFQWVSAHLAVDSNGGKFWQLMLSERCVQAACGSERNVKIFAENEGISLEYCDDVAAETGCNFMVDGRPIRHVRLDCRVALVDESKVETQKKKKKTKKSPESGFIRKHLVEEDAPWFL